MKPLPSMNYSSSCLPHNSNDRFSSGMPGIAHVFFGSDSTIASFESEFKIK